MIDMKLSGKREKKSTDQPVGYYKPAYPWGLDINLEDESLKKLGMDISDMKVGQKISIMAEAKVTNISQTVNEKGEDHRAIGLQICRMDKPVVAKHDRTETGKKMLGRKY